MALNQPNWLKSHLKSKQNIPDQITILDKPRYTGAGADGRIQPAMPVMKQLHEGEGVVPAAVMAEVGGNKGLTRAIAEKLEEKGVMRMPQASRQTIEKAHMMNPNAMNYAEGTLVPEDMSAIRNRLQQEDTGQIKPPTVAPVEDMAAIRRGLQAQDTGKIIPFPTPSSTTPQVEDMSAIRQRVGSETLGMPVVNKTPAPVENMTAIRQRIGAETLGRPVMTTASTTAPAEDMTAIRRGLAFQNSGFATQAEYDNAAKMGIFTKKDYDTEMAARQPSQAPVGMPQVTPRGMDTYRKFYDYAAQQADARSAVGDQALAMRMAQNPNLTEGAKNTMLQEQIMSRGSQQSKLAGDAAQQAISYQTSQNDKAMNAMLAAGDVDGYASMFQQEFGVPINKEAMKSAVNQKAFSSGMSQLNTYVAQFGDKANANDPIAQGILKSIWWSATGNVVEMNPEWANTFLENVKQSQSPIYQALNAYPESEAYLIWGSAIDGLKDPLTNKTGYDAFKSLFARDMTKGFMKYDPATQDFTVTAGGALESLFLNNPTVDLNAGSGSTTTTSQPTFTYSSLNTGNTVDYNGKKWTVGEPLEDGSKVLRSDDGTWARVGSDNRLYTYTASNTTGLQTIGGKTYNNGTEVTASVAGKTGLPVNKDTEGSFITVGTQRVPVTVGADGKVAIKGSFVDAGKLYVDGKEMKSAGFTSGGALTLSDTAQADFDSKGFTIATSGGKTYKVTNDGQAPELYSTQHLIADMALMSPKEITDSVDSLIKNGVGKDEIFKTYSDTLSGSTANPIILSKLLEIESAQAKANLPALLGNGKIDISKYPTIKSAVEGMTTNPGTGSIETYTVPVKGGKRETRYKYTPISQTSVPGAGTITTLNGKQYYVKATPERTEAGSSYWNYPRVLVALDGSGTEITQNYLST